MTSLKLIASGLLATLLLNPLMAVAAVCNLPNVVSGFSNGIQNTRVDAEISHQALIGKTIDADFSYKVLFYHTKGRVEGDSGPKSFGQDMLEVYTLLIKEVIKESPAKEAEAMAIFHGYRAPDVRPGSAYQELFPYYEQAQKEMLTKSAGTTEEHVRATVANDVAMLHSTLDNGDSLMMVAHSQGTLWANAALTQLAQSHPNKAAQVRLLSVGMAASYVWQTPGSAYQNAYITNRNDQVINLLRSFTGGSTAVPMAGNATHSLTWAEPMGHSFVGVYLDNAEETGSKFFNLHREGVNVTRLENKGEPLATVDITYDVGLVLSDQQMPAFQWYGPFYSSAGNRGNFDLKEQRMRTGPTTIRSISSWYCGYLKPVQAGDKFPLILTESQSYGKPAIVSGGVRFNQDFFAIREFGAGQHHPLHAWDWDVGTVTIVDSPLGLKAELTLN